MNDKTESPATTSETAEDVLSTDIRNLIVMDTQFWWRGRTELKLADIQRLEARGWVAEGHENAEYDITDEGRAVIERALAGRAEAVAYRLRTGSDRRKWQWMDGTPSAGAVREAELHGWTVEYAYTYTDPPASMPEVTRLIAAGQALSAVLPSVQGEANYFAREELRAFRAALTAALQEQRP